MAVVLRLVKGRRGVGGGGGWVAGARGRRGGRFAAIRANSLRSNSALGGSSYPHLADGGSANVTTSSLPPLA